MKQTGEKWNEYYLIRFADFYGFGGEKAYKSVKLTKSEFLNLASQCSIVQNLKISRREAAAKLRELMKS